MQDEFDLNAKNKITRHVKMMKPVALRQLDEFMDRTDIAVKIGITPSGISTALTRDTVRAPVELLAKKVLEETKNNGVKHRSRIIIVKVNPEQYGILKPVIEAVGARIAFAEEV